MTSVGMINRPLEPYGKKIKRMIPPSNFVKQMVIRSYQNEQMLNLHTWRLPSISLEKKGFSRKAVDVSQSTTFQPSCISSNGSCSVNSGMRGQFPLASIQQTVDSSVPEIWVRYFSLQLRSIDKPLIKS